MNIRKQCVDEIQRRLKAAGERVYSRGIPDHPTFKSAPQAAQHVVRLLGEADAVLVMRDQSLHYVRVAVLNAGIRLVIPNKAGDEVYRLPPEALMEQQRNGKPGLYIDPMPRCAELYDGDIDAVLVGCLAFDPAEPRLYSFDTDRTAGTLESLYAGTDGGFRLSVDVPILAVASDAQQVSGWPDSAKSFVRADAVVTPTRLVMLGLTGPRTNTSRMEAC